MKLIMYSEFFKINGKIYLFNILNGALIYINDDAMKRLKKFIQTNNIEWLSKKEQTLLMRNGFLVEDFMNESQSAKSYYENSKVALSKTLKIDYALTSKCNLNCPYCFEKERLNKSYLSPGFSREVDRRLLKFILNSVSQENFQKVKITWYGGEPFLECGRIREFLKKMEDTKIRVENVFVTNGTILTRRCLNMLQNVNVDYIQITLDGIKDTHDKRRIKLNGEGTFERIVGNITTLVKRSFQVVIRINVDKKTRIRVLS